MQRAMARQAEAEREHRAKVIHAEGVFAASQRLSEKAAVTASEPAALQLLYLQTLTDIASDRSSVIMFPLPIQLLSAFLNTPLSSLWGTAGPSLTEWTGHRARCTAIFTLPRLVARNRRAAYSVSPTPTKYRMSRSSQNPEPLSPEPGAAQQRVRPWASLAFANYRWLWASGLFGSVGQQIRQLANLYLVYDLSGSTLQLGLLGLTRAIPLFVVGLFGGALADSMDRKRLIMLTQSANLLVAATLAGLAFSGNLAVWHLYAATMLTGMLLILEQPARQSLIPALVPRSHLLNAYTLNSFIRQGSLLMGPALAGFVIDGRGGGMDGAGIAYLVNVAFYVPVFAGLLMVRIPKGTHLAEIRRRGFRPKEVFEGLKYVWSTNILLAIIALDAVVTLLTGYRAMMPVFAEEILHAGGSGLGLLLSAPAVGFTAGSLGLLIIGKISRTGLVVLLSVAGYAIAMALFAISDVLYLSLFFLVLVGGLDGISSIVRQTTLQLVVPDELRGRATSVQLVFAIGAPGIGEFLTGAAAVYISAPGAIFAGAVLSLAFVGFVAMRWREVTAFRL
jgi:MFS family permease